jgi:hypothetical protein
MESFFCDWLKSLSTMSSTLSLWVTQVIASFFKSVYNNTIPCYVFYLILSYCVYPFIHWWTLRQLPSPGQCDQCAVTCILHLKHTHHWSSLTTDLGLGFKPRRARHTSCCLSGWLFCIYIKEFINLVITGPMRNQRDTKIPCEFAHNFLCSHRPPPALP